MPVETDLIPELRHWNEGRGIDLAEWIFIQGRADHALGFSALMWPNIIAFEGYVLRSPLDVDRLRAWERVGLSPTQIETVMNAFLFDGIFPDDRSEENVKNVQLNHLAARMADMLSAKLHRDFPDRSLLAFVIDDEDDFGVSFHEVR